MYVNWLNGKKTIQTVLISLEEMQPTIFPVETDRLAVNNEVRQLFGNLW